MPQLNLATEVSRAQVVGRRRRMFYLLAAGLVVLVAFSWLIPFFLTQSTETALAQVELDIAGVQAQLRSRQDTVSPIVLFLDRVAALRQRLEARLGWSRVFAELERLLPGNASFRGLRGTVENGLLLAQVLVPSLDAAADLVASFQSVPQANDTAFRQVNVKTVAAEDSTGGGYILSLELSVPAELLRLAGGATSTPPLANTVAPPPASTVTSPTPSPLPTAP